MLKTESNAMESVNAHSLFMNNTIDISLISTYMHINDFTMHAAVQ